MKDMISRMVACLILAFMYGMSMATTYPNLAGIIIRMSIAAPMFWILFDIVHDAWMKLK